jgi:hypothetical protein
MLPTCRNKQLMLKSICTSSTVHLHSHEKSTGHRGRSSIEDFQLLQLQHSVARYECLIQPQVYTQPEQEREHRQFEWLLDDDDVGNGIGRAGDSVFRVERWGGRSASGSLPKTARFGRRSICSRRWGEVRPQLSIIGPEGQRTKAVCRERRAAARRAQLLYTALCNAVLRAAYHFQPIIVLIDWPSKRGGAALLGVFLLGFFVIYFLDQFFFVGLPERIFFKNFKI